jgi:hypothetical protein
VLPARPIVQTDVTPNVTLAKESPDQGRSARLERHPPANKWRKGYRGDVTFVSRVEVPVAAETPRCCYKQPLR